MHKKGYVQRNKPKLIQIKGLRQCSSQELEEHCPQTQKKPSNAQPHKWVFFASKTCLFYTNKSQYHTQTCLNPKN
jgi:hypothetical protein